MADDPLPHLETFARAAELGSFTAAARGLRLTQAAVSQRIRALEQALDVSLFRRQAGRVFLTEAGQRLFRYAQQIVALQEQARQEVTGKRVPLAGALTLAASSVPGEHLLPPILGAFRRKYPHIQVKASVADSAAVLEQVEHGKADLGLVGKKQDSPHLEFRTFACDEMVLVVPADHPWKKRRRLRLDELCRQPLLLREVGSGSRWCLEQGLARAGKSVGDLQVVLELGSNEGIKEAVQGGVGVALLSTHSVAREVKSGRLHALRVTGLELQRDLFAVRDRRRALSIPARLFLDFLAPCPRARKK